MTDFSYKDFQFDHYSSIGEKGYSKDLEIFSRKKLFGSLIVRKDGTLKELGFLKTLLNYHNNRKLKNLTKLRAMHFIAYGIKRQNLLGKAGSKKDHLDKIVGFARRVGIEKDDIKRLNKLVQANTDKEIDAVIEEFYKNHSKEYQSFEKEYLWIHNYTQGKNRGSFTGTKLKNLGEITSPEKQTEIKLQGAGSRPSFAAQIAARYRKNALNLLEEEEASKRAEKAEIERQEDFNKQKAEKEAEKSLTPEERRLRGKKKNEAKQRQVKEQRDRESVEDLYRAGIARRRRDMSTSRDESAPDFEDYDVKLPTRTFFDLNREIEENGGVAGGLLKEYNKLFDDFKQKFHAFKMNPSDTNLKNEIKIKSTSLAGIVENFKGKTPQIRTFFLDYREQALETIEGMIQEANHDVEKAQEAGSTNLQNLKKTKNMLEQTKEKVIKFFQSMEKFIAITDTKEGENSLDLATKMLNDPSLKAVFNEDIQFGKQFYEANAKADEEGGDADWN